MKSYAKKFYTSAKWKKCRESYLKSISFVCERCGGIATIVHHKNHITPKNIDNPDITFNWDNLEGLCQDCHNKEHMLKENCTRDDIIFDSLGNPLLKKDPPLNDSYC